MYSALFGGTIFVAQLALQLLGVIDFEGLEIVEEGDGDDGAFTLLSINVLSSFIMMFGCVGMMCYKEMGMSREISVIFGVAAGVGMVYVTKNLVGILMKLRHDGAETCLSQFMEQSTVITITINPDSNTGAVMFNGETYKAFSEDNTMLPVATRVIVVGYEDSHLIVKKEFE